MEQEITAPTLSAFDEIVDHWFNERIHNSMLSRDAQYYNQLREEVEELKWRLVASKPQ